MTSHETKSPQAEIETMRQRLQDAANRADTIRSELKSAARKGQWLRPLHSRFREIGNRTLVTLPRATRQTQNDWKRAAEARLKEQYGRWMQQLEAVLDRLKGKSDDSAQ
jgi:uncharacterized protein YukE